MKGCWNPAICKQHLFLFPLKPQQWDSTKTWQSYNLWAVDVCVNYFLKTEQLNVLEGAARADLLNNATHYHRRGYSHIILYSVLQNTCHEDWEHKIEKNARGAKNHREALIWRASHFSLKYEPITDNYFHIHYSKSWKFVTNLAASKSTNPHKRD